MIAQQIAIKALQGLLAAFKFVFLNGKWICKNLVYKTISELTSSKRQNENLYYIKVLCNLDSLIL